MYKEHFYITMVRSFVVLLLSILIGLVATAKNKQTEVLIISTIQKTHTLNEKYNYDSLFHFIERWNPDVIGVEVRKEDIHSAEEYLKANYPYEMYHAISKYKQEKNIWY